MKIRKPLLLITVTVMAAILLSSCNMGATPAPAVVPGAAETQAFSIVLTQVALQQTQTAQAIPPTEMPTATPFPTPTLSGNPTFPPVGGGVNPPLELSPIPGFTPLASVASPVPTGGLAPTKNGCNDGMFIDETKPYDGAQMKPGEDFTKGWTIKNTGTCAWDEGYSFVIYKQDTLDITDVRGESTSITIKKVEDVIKPNMSQLFLLKLKAPTAPGEYKWYWKLQDDSGNLFGPRVSVVFVVIK